VNRALLMFAVVTVVFACVNDQQPPADSRVPILGSVSHQMPSRAVGDTFQVSVVLPRSYFADTTRRFPVVYLLDGNELIGVAASVAWELWVSGMPEVILIGVDYPVADLDQSQGIRFRDLTPSEDRAAIAAQGPEYDALGLPAPTLSGGGPLFMTFLLDELGPRIDSLYRTDASNRTLLGLSLGGLLALHVLLERAEYYQNYVVLSPSLWWNKDETVARFTARPADRKPVQRLFVSVGLAEEDSLYRMVKNVRRLEAIVAKQPSVALATRFQYFPDENHNSGWPAAMSRGLRFAFRLWPPTGQRN
jgi:uncharacterized protein